MLCLQLLFRSHIWLTLAMFCSAENFPENEIEKIDSNLIKLKSNLSIIYTMSLRVNYEFYV